MADDPGFDDFVKALSAQKLPPVHRWKPSAVRDMDLVIDASGEWHYQGTPFGRQDLVRLLSSVLLREGEEYFLVSPGEKLRITVEDVPFVAIDFEATGSAENQRIVFDTNVGYKAPLDADHPLTVRAHSGPGEEIPYIAVRDGLEARLARGVFYRLVTLGEERERDGRSVFGVCSYGCFFELGDVTW